MATQPIKQSGALGFFETTIGRAIRRAVVLALAAGATALLTSIINDPTFAHATPADGLVFVFYWVARTLMDLLSPKITNL